MGLDPGDDVFQAALAEHARRRARVLVPGACNLGVRVQGVCTSSHAFLDLDLVAPLRSHDQAATLSLAYPPPHSRQNLGVTNKFYVEFGFNADNFDGGTGANTYTLWKYFGWTGLLLDGGRENPAINLHKEMITPANIVSLFDKYLVPREPDFVSIDVDSMDLWLFQALVRGGYRPRVVTMEYNMNLPIDANLMQAVDAGHEFDYAFGASLRAVATVAKELGYVLVHVVEGLDAVLVRRDLMQGVAIHPLEAWAACCTNKTVHVIPTPARVGSLLDYGVFAATGDVGQAKAAARRYLADRPYLMTRPAM